MNSEMAFPYNWHLHNDADKNWNIIHVNVNDDFCSSPLCNKGQILIHGRNNDFQIFSIKKRSRCLPIGGGITLLNSTLISLPICFLFLFIIPKSVAKRLEKIQRDFLWRGGALEKKPHLVNWSTICKDKKRGSLGIKDLSTINIALLGKWCWRFTLKRDMLWRKLILGKFVEELGVGALKRGEKVME